MKDQIAAFVPYTIKYEWANSQSCKKLYYLIEQDRKERLEKQQYDPQHYTSMYGERT